MKKNSIIIIIVIVTLIGLMSWTLASNKSEINSRKEVKISEDNIAVTVVAAQMQETILPSQSGLSPILEKCRKRLQLSWMLCAVRRELQM